MTHDVLDRVLDAQRLNSTLTGSQLRRAALDLVALQRTPGTVLLTYDACGERILGYALALDPTMHAPFDRTRTLPEGAICLLVGGAIAGPVGVADAAAVARRLGASTVHAAILCGWPAPITGVDQIHAIATSHSTAA